MLLDGLPAWGRRKLDLIADAVAARAAGPVRVLDVGCGTGELVTLPLWARVHRDGVSILGVDPDAASVARASEVAAAHDVRGARFERAGIEDVGGVFDVVVCSEVIEHQHDAVAFSRALRARVADDGVVIVTTPNGYGYNELERRVMYTAFDVAGRLPPVLRKAARAAYRRVRSRAHSHAGPAVFGTLNFRDDVHRQFFTTRSLRRTLAAGGLRVERIVSVRMLGGLAGGIAERKLGLDRFTPRTPPVLTAAWLAVCRPAPG